MLILPKSRQKTSNKKAQPMGGYEDFVFILTHHYDSNNKRAQPMGFEPTISAVTGRRFEPAKLRLHYAGEGNRTPDLSLMKTLL